MPKVFIRVDGNSQIGYGHFYRMIALAQMLQPAFETTFICNQLDGCLINEIENTFDCLIIKTETLQEEVEIINSKVKLSDAIFVLDGYQFDSEYQKKIKKYVYKLVCIDDTYLHTYHCDAIINHGLFIDNKKYKTTSYTKIYCGPQYALLRKDFLDLAKKAKKENFQHNIFISFGGADLYNFTLTALQYAYKFLSNINKIFILVGDAYSYKNELHNFINTNKITEQCEIKTRLNSKELSELLLQCNIAIVSSSNILYELSCVKVSVISGYYAENQVLLNEGMTKLNCIYNLGNLHETTIHQWKEAFQKISDTSFQKLLTQNQQAIFDGLSSIRINSIFKVLSVDTIYNFRKVQSNDLLLLFNWANDKEVRKYSFNSNPITIEEHTKWFNQKITNPNSYLYIFEVNGIPNGHIRFDIVENLAIISYLLAPESRGKGYGSIILEYGVFTFLSELKHNIKEIIGYVQFSNIASIKCFEKLHFEKYTDTTKDNAYKFVKKI